MNNKGLIKRVTIGSSDDIKFADKKIFFNQYETDEFKYTVEDKGKIFFAGYSLDATINYQLAKAIDPSNNYFAIVNTFIIPKVIITDRLKNYLIKNRNFSRLKDDNDILLVSFGDYIRDKVHLDYKEEKKLKVEDKKHKIHFIGDYYNSRFNFEHIESIADKKIVRYKKMFYTTEYDYSYYLYEPVRWYLNIKTNEMVMNTALFINRIGVDNLANLKDKSTIRLEDTDFYKEFFGKYFLEDVFYNEDIFKKTNMFYRDKPEIEKTNENIKFDGIEKIKLSNLDSIKKTKDRFDYNPDDDEEYYLYDNNGIIERINVENNSLVANLNEIVSEEMDHNHDLSIASVKGSYILPTIIINDELKKYLIQNKTSNKREDGKYVVSFGEYLGKESNNSIDLIKSKLLSKPKEEIKSAFEYNKDSTRKIISVYDMGETKSTDNGYTIEPLEWILDINTNELVLSKKIYVNFDIGVLSEIDLSKNIKIDDTYFYKNYLSNTFINEMFRNEEYFKVERKENDNENEFETIIRSIIKSIPDDNNKKFFIEKIEKIAIIYNNDLQKYLKNINNRLTFGIDDKSTLENNLRIDLSSIKDEIKRYEINTYYYNEVINYINEIEKILNGELIENPDEFQDLLYNLLHISIKYIENDDYKSLLKKELCEKTKVLVDNYKDKLYKQEKIDNPEFSNKEELVVYLRRQLHPILERITDDVDKKDAYEQINKNMQEMLSYTYKQSRNRIYDVYLSLLNEGFVELNGIMSPEDHKHYDEYLKELLNIKLDYSRDMNDICTEIINKYCSLKRLFYTVDESQRRIDEIKPIRLNKIKSSR